MNLLFKAIFAVVFTFYGLQGHTQNLALGPIPFGICQGLPVSVNLTTVGDFGPSNTFTLQIAPDYSTTTYNLPYTRVGNILTFLVPSGIALNEGWAYRIKAISSDPYIESPWTNSTQIYSPASISLVSANPTVLNPYQTSTLNFRYSGTMPLTATLSDGSSFVFSDPSYYYNATNKPITVSASGTYSVVKAENRCGLGTASGSVQLQVNPVVIRTLSASPSIVCRGDTLRVSYSKGLGSFNAGNQFKVKLVSATYSNLPTYTLPAIESNGVVKAVIPDSVQDGQWGYRLFKVYLMSTSPVVETTNELLVEIRPRASAEISSESKTIPYGETYNLQVRFRGLGPYQATLSDGTNLETTDLNNGIGNVAYKPGQSTLYTIKRFTSGCSMNTLLPSSAQVLVNPGMWIDSIPSLNKNHCEGQTVRLRYATNVPFSEQTRIQVTLARVNSDWESKPVTARLEPGNWLSFEIPPLETNIGYDSRNYYIRLQSYSPDLATIQRGIWLDPNIRISRPPDVAQFQNLQPDALTNPDITYLSILTNGGGYYRVTVDNGIQQFTSDNSWFPYFSVYVSRTTTFSLVSVSNECGTFRPANVTKTVTVQNPSPNRIYLKPVSAYVCYRDSMTVSIIPEGEFLPGNEFRVQAADMSLGTGWGWTEAGVYGRSQGTSIRFKLPGSSKIRVVSTNPVTVSEEMTVSVAPDLSAQILPFDDYNLYLYNGTPTRTVLPGEPVSLPIVVNMPTSTGPYAVTYTNGSEVFSFTSNSWSAEQSGIRLTKTTTFSLVDVRNECGSGTMQGSATFTVVPFRLKTVLPNGYNTNGGDIYASCGGGEVSVPFLTDRTPPQGTTFTLQIGSRQDSVFHDLAESQTSPLIGRIPTNLLPGDYWLRVVVKNTEISTIWLKTRISQPPTATIRPPVSGTLLNVGEVFRPGVTLTGSSPWEVQYSNNVTAQYSSSPGQPTFSPEKATSYFIRYVTNSCGYGTVSGEAAVRIKPSLTIQRQDLSKDCIGSTLQIAYQAAGDFDPANEFKLELTDDSGVFLRVLTRLAYTSGIFQYTIPADLKPGSYRIYLRSSSPNLSSLAGIPFTVYDTPIISISGSTSINYSQSTSLLLRNNQQTAYGELVSLTLSTGQSVTQYFSGNTPTSIVVAPTQTTTFSVVSAIGQCGAGKTLGSATVTVNPFLRRSVSTGPTGFNTICAGSPMAVPFTTSGGFSPDNQFYGQLIDSSGIVIHTFSTYSTRSPLSVDLPSELPGGWGYRIRILSTDDSTSSSASGSFFAIQEKATGAFRMTAATRTDDQQVMIPLQFGGASPWSYTILAGSHTITGSSATNQISTITSQSALQFTLVSIANVCGSGKVLQPDTFRVYAGMTTLKAGDWSDQTIWSGNRRPILTDTVIIRHRVQLPISITGQVKHILYETGGKLVFGSGAHIQTN